MTWTNAGRGWKEGQKTDKGVYHATEVDTKKSINHNGRMSVHKYQRKDGRTYYYVEKSHRGRRLLKRGFRSRKAAADYERKWMDEIDLGLSGQVIETTFEEYKEWWLDRRSYLKNSTLRTYASILNQLADDIGDISMTQISPTLVQEVLSHTKSPKTRSNELALLKTLFKEAVMYGYLQRSPVAEIPRPKVRKKEMEYLSPAEATRLIESAEGRTRLLLEVAVLTGMRRGEIFGLKGKDIKPGYMRVQRARYEGKKLEPPKSRLAIRNIPIGETLQKHLNGAEKAEDELLFPGDPVHFVRAVFNPLVKRAKVKKIRFQDLRHSFAALMVSLGANPKYLQKLMGHASITTTLDTYGHLYPEDYTWMAGELEKKVFPSEHH